VQRSRLCELFQIEFGTAPTHYHKTLRLEKASERLANSLDKVEVIIAELGYHRSRFFRDFKARFGVTPNQYRVRHIEASVGRKDAERKVIV
jgi:AraC-like DNA-binding protein